MKIKSLLFCLLSIATFTFGQDTDEYVQLEIEGIYEYPYGDSYAIQLIETEGENKWSLTMVIGGCEAQAAARHMYDIEFSRPLTYDLISTVFDATSLDLQHILITKLEGGTYYAVLVVKDGKKTIKIDARPSDSMNIAMRTEVPIYATQTVWEEAREDYIKPVEEEE